MQALQAQGGQAGRRGPGFALRWRCRQLGLKGDAGGALPHLQLAAQGAAGQAGVDGAGVDLLQLGYALPLPVCEFA